MLQIENHLIENYSHRTINTYKIYVISVYITELIEAYSKHIESLLLIISLKYHYDITINNINEYI